LKAVGLTDRWLEWDERLESLQGWRVERDVGCDAAVESAHRWRLLGNFMDIFLPETVKTEIIVVPPVG
jgi:hypothetical protein